MPKKRINDKHNPLVTLFHILANALLDDETGIDATAFNALMLLGQFVSVESVDEITKKVREVDGRYKFDQ